MSRSCSRRADLAVRAAHEAGAGHRRAATTRPSARPPPGGTGCATTCRAPRPRRAVPARSSRSSSLDQQRITGIEAQLRWRHPELGEIPPDRVPARSPSAPASSVSCCAGRCARRPPPSVAGLPDGEEPLQRRPQGRRPATSRTGTLVADVEQRAARLRPGARSGWSCRSPPPTVTSDDERIGLDVAACGSWACTWPSTASAAALRAGRTSPGCRSTSSSSTAR